MKITSRNKSLILTIILIAYTMIIIDNSVVITGMPKIQLEMHFSELGLSWITSAYALTFGGFLLLGAKAGDIFGRRNMLIFGMMIFALASLMVGLSSTPAALIISRAVQGAGAALLAPATLAILQTTFDNVHEKARAISFYAAAGGVSASLGLILGGIVAEYWSWRVGFLINIPVSVALIILSLRHIPESEKHTGKFDFLGAITSTLGMGCLVYSTISSASNGWSSSETILFFFTSVILLTLFYKSQKKLEHAIMPMRIFEDKRRAGSYLARFLFVGANVAFFFYSTLYMQGVLHYSPAIAGLAFLPSMTVNFVNALATPRISKYFSKIKILFINLAISFLGFALLSRVQADSDYLSGLALPMILIGFGMGGAMGPLTSFGIENVLPQDAGAASGAVNAAHQMGSSLGLSIIVSAASMITLAVGHNDISELMSTAMLFSSFFVFLSILTTILMIRDN